MACDNKYENLEFLTGISYSGKEYVGIVINQDNQITSFYDVESIHSQSLKKKFLEFGELWWWESNRQIPIDIFLRHEMIQFKECIKTFSNKDVEILFGPVTSMQSLLKKRIKRRSIQLVRKTT